MALSINRNCDDKGHSLFAPDGERKYLNHSERLRFSDAASFIGNQTPAICTLCETLLWTGCRISEALALTASDFYDEEGVVTIRTLKQKTYSEFRQVPVPNELLELIKTVHHVNEPRPRRLWPWHRVTAYQHIKKVMTLTGITGRKACPRGLRHSFGVHCTMTGVSVQFIQRWLGHGSLNSTMIYTNIVGREEQQIAQKCWKNIVVAPRLKNVTQKATRHNLTAFFL